MSANSPNQNNFWLRTILSDRANYIISKMEKGCCDYSTALLDAQQNWNGDSAKDYEGRDTVNLLSTLVEYCCGVKIVLSDIFCRGLAFLSPLDFEMADRFGFAIKYLGIVRTRGNTLDVRIHPTMIPQTSPLSLVSGAQFATEWGVIGQVSPIGLIANSTGVSLEALPRFETQKGISVANILDLNACYYIRFTIQDSLEAVAAITKVLSNCHIGIRHLHKKGQQPGSIVPLVVVTHEANEKNMRAALKEIDGMSFITQMTKIIRIDEEPT